MDGKLRFKMDLQTIPKNLRPSVIRSSTKILLSILVHKGEEKMGGSARVRRCCPAAKFGVLENAGQVIMKI